MKERGPIFYDAERVRWRRTRRVMEISGVLLTAAARVFFRQHRGQRRASRRTASRHAPDLSRAQAQDRNRKSFAGSRRPSSPRRKPRHRSRNLRSVARRVLRQLGLQQPRVAQAPLQRSRRIDSRATSRRHVRRRAHDRRLRALSNGESAARRKRFRSSKTTSSIAG